MITPEMVSRKHVLECGSYDVNGSVRPWCEAFQPASYTGIDLRPGPRVDIAMTADALAYSDEFEERYDLVVSTEMLEHCENWRTAIYGMLFALKRDGIIVLTTRSPGFHVHDYPGDYWRYPVPLMRQILETAGLDVISCEDDPFPGHPGVFAVARKPDDWRWTHDAEAAWLDVNLPGAG